MCINKDHCSELFGSGQTIYSVDFKAQHISATGVPRYRLALADVTEEMMSGAVGDLFYLQPEISLVLCRERQADARQEQGNHQECERCASHDCFPQDCLTHGY